MIDLNVSGEREGVTGLQADSFRGASSLSTLVASISVSLFPDNSDVFLPQIKRLQICDWGVHVRVRSDVLQDRELRGAFTELLEDVCRSQYLPLSRFE